MICSLFTVSPNAEELSSDTLSEGSVLYNLQTKSFLLEKNADKEIFCGFLPRLTVCILLTESGENLETEITVEKSTRANTPQYSSADIKDGDRISLGDLMTAVLIGNSQEAAVAIAFHLSEDGTLDSFIKKMNEKAKEIGAVNTVFTNVTGYNDKNKPSKTTLRDAAAICSYAIGLDYILDRSDTAYTLLTVNGTSRPLYTKNSLVESSSAYYYRRATGLAVSGDNSGGYTAASTILNNNSRFLALNYSDKLDSALSDTIKLLKYAIEAYEIRDIINKNSPITEVGVKLGKDSDYVVLYSDSDVKVSLPKTVKDEEIAVQYEDVPPVISAPVESGTAYGFAVYYYNGVEIGRTTLTARTNITLDLIAYYTEEISSLFKNPLLWVAIGVVILLLLLYLIASNISKSNKKKKEKTKRKDRVHGKLK